MQVKQSLKVLVAFLAVMGVAQSATAQTKIGTVDMQQALETVEAGKKAKANLEKEVAKKRTELQKQEATLKKLHEEFQKKSMVLSEKVRTKKQMELQTKIQQFQELSMRTQQDLQRQEKELTEPIIDRLREVIAEIANKEGYTMVLEKNRNTVLFYQENNDLTDKVVELYNKKFKS